ncbi:protein DELAY OF GERMINATION 1-like [Typha angustifolia]|uniref:protein DELAY OF GERMINATION 1-like n=1 Tax=Typha angustifolia TaxID=59011 RepID=UPI003C2C1473
MTMSASRANGEYFADFFEQRMSEQSRDLAALRRAAGNSDDADGSLRHLVERVVGHYEYYYRAKAASARCDVLPMFSPTWTSSTENLFLWAGGWRPSTAFHLLYSKSGLQLEAELDQILLVNFNLSFLFGILYRSKVKLLCSPGPSASSRPLNRIDQFHRRTLSREKEISEEAATVQEEVGKMVEIAAHVPGGGKDAEMEGEMAGKREAMRRVLEKADELRLETIKAVVGILRPIQAVHFLIAAAELQLAVHGFGKRKDRAESDSSG